MDTTLVALSLVTGLLTGGLFSYLGVPIPAPPKLAGLMGIVGIFLGYQAVEATGAGVDLLARLGLA